MWIHFGHGDKRRGECHRFQTQGAEVRPSAVGGLELFLAWFRRRSSTPFRWLTIARFISFVRSSEVIRSHIDTLCCGRASHMF